MEVNDYVNSNILVSSTDASTLSSSINVAALEKIDLTKENSNSFSLNLNTDGRRSELGISLKAMMETISSSQISLKNLNEQSSILTTIKNAAEISVNTGDVVALEDLQPSVEELMTKYNYLSSNINANFAKYQQETDSHNYFDGVLGAKPLNPSEIIKATDKQFEIVSSEKKFFEQNFQKSTDQALEVISKEIDKSNKEAPFKNIDFGKNIANFTSANINNVVGSVVSSQANAIPANSPKLLA